jgi:hypothetical protein
MSKKRLGRLRTDQKFALRSLRDLLAEPVVSKYLDIIRGKTGINDIPCAICPTGPAHSPAFAPDGPEGLLPQSTEPYVVDARVQTNPDFPYTSHEQTSRLPSPNHSDSAGWDIAMTRGFPMEDPRGQYQSGWPGLSHPQTASGEYLGDDNFGQSSFRTTSQPTDMPPAALNAEIPAASEYQPWQPGRLEASSLDSELNSQSYIGITADRLDREVTSVPILTPGQTSDSNSMNPHTPIPPNRQAWTPSSDTPSYPEFYQYIRYNSVMNDDSIPGPSHARDVSSSPDAGRRPSILSEVSDQESKRARQISPARRNPLPLMTLEDLQTRECDMIQSVLRQLAVRFEGMADHISKRSRIVAPVKDFLLNVSPF